MKPGPIQRSCKKPTKNADFDEVDPATAYDEFPELEDHVQEHPEIGRVRIYRGSVTTDAVQWHAESEENLVILIDGDLWVDGLLELAADQDEDSAQQVFVRGNLSARDVVVGWDAQLTVMGDLEAERLVMCGGGNLGNITVEKALRAGLVLEWTDGQIRAGSGSPAVWARQKHNIKIDDAKWVQPANAVAAKFLDAEGEPKQRDLLNALRAGESAFA